MFVGVLVQIFVLSTSVCLNSPNYFWFPSAPRLPSMPALPLMLLCWLSRLEPEILLRAKQDFMKIDSAADLEWVSFPVRAIGFFNFLICSVQVAWSVGCFKTFFFDCCIHEFFAWVWQFFSQVLTEMRRTPSAGDLVNVHRLFLVSSYLSRQ